MLEFEQLLAMKLDVGDPLHIAGQSPDWDCVKPCIIIGHKDGTPVLQAPGGPRLNSDELLPAGTLRTQGKPGQTPTEVLTLGAYEQIVPEELAGKTIATGKEFYEDVLIICEDGSYVKLTAEYHHGEISLERNNLTMQDLRVLDLIDIATWTAYETEQAGARDGAEENHAMRSLSQAISSLGVDRVKAIVDNQMDARI
jgi:hypothetical protein